jgi:hypothetical protein
MLQCGAVCGVVGCGVCVRVKLCVGMWVSVAKFIVRENDEWKRGGEGD